MKKIIALLLVLTMVLSLAACGAPAKSDKITLDVIISQYGNYTQAWWTEFEKNFEAANTNIDLNIEIVSWSDIYSVVTTRISNNAQPDILNISGFADYVADDLLMPAEEYVSEAVKENFIDSFWASNAIDGTVWALPILASCRAMFCNMDLLNAAGITEAPKTWEEVNAACAAVRAKYGADIVPWGLDISEDEGQAAFSYYAFNFGGGFVGADGKWNLNSAENVKAVEYIKSLIDAGYCNANPYTDTRYPLQTLFATGKMAMMIGPMNMVGSVAEATVTNYVAAPIPGMGQGLGICDQLMAFKDPAAKEADPARTEAIIKFFDAFYECETYSDYMVYEGFLPATEDSSEYLAKNAEKHDVCGTDGKVVGDSAYFATFCAQLPDCQFYPMQIPNWMDVRNGVIKVEQDVCQGLMTAQEALDALQAQVAG